MTPDLFEKGAERLELHKAKLSTDVTSGDRGASYGRIHTEPWPGVCTRRLATRSAYMSAQLD